MSQNSSQTKWIFYVVLGILAVASFYLIRAYIGLFFLALIITMLFDPLYRWFVKHIKQPTFASILTTLVVIFLVVLPLVFIITIAITQAVYYFNYFAKTLNSDNQIVSYILSLANQLPQNPLTALNLSSLNKNPNILSFLSGSLTAVGTFLFNNLIPLITYSIQAIAQTIFFFVFIVYLFPFRPKLFSALEKITPLNIEDHHRFLDRFEAVTVTTLKAMVIVGCIQGFLGGLMLAILKFPAAAFWGFAMAIISIIPLGSGVIWVPISIFLVLNGHWLQGLILFIWGITVISTIDNIIRARLLSGGKAQLPEILTLLSVLGGVNTFGFWGFIYGPAIIGLFYTAVTIYSENKAKYFSR